MQYVMSNRSEFIVQNFKFITGSSKEKNGMEKSLANYFFKCKNKSVLETIYIV